MPQERGAGQGAGGAADARLARYAEWLGLQPSVVELARGQTSDVVISRRLRRVWRFPRTEAGVSRLVLAAERTQAARALGLPAPEVLDLVPDLAPGRAHVAFRYLQGSGLTPVVLAGLDELARRRLCSDVAHLLRQFRSGPLSQWPGPEIGWVERWERLAEYVRVEVFPGLDPIGRRVADADLVAAVRAARGAPGGLLHGDLGSTNLLVDPIDGHLTGVLDWEGAGPGDPAVDLAAIRSTLDKDPGQPPLNGLLLEQDPTLAADLARSSAYIATFALQEALHGARTADADAWAAGTAPYR